MSAPLVPGSPPDLEFVYFLNTAVDVYSFPPPQNFELYSEYFDLQDLKTEANVGGLYFTGSSFANNGNPNAFIGTLDLGELGTIVFLFSIPPNLPLNPETGFYIPYQTFYCRILQGSGDFKFIQSGFVVIYTFPTGRYVYVYLDK